MSYRLSLVSGLAIAVGCEPGRPTGAADYALSLTPAALTIVQGANSTTTVTITSTSFTGAVTLSLGGAPAGVTGSFSPAAPTGSSTLTVSVGATVAPGVYDLTVIGTGSPGNRSTPLTLTVSVPVYYTLSLSPAAFTIAPGAEGTTTVNIARTNFTGAVTLSLGGAPAGVTGSFDPAGPTGTSSTLTVSVGAAVAPGIYDLRVNGTATPGDYSMPLTLTVSAAPDYALSLAPAALTIAQGADGSTTVNITRSNFSGAVTLSLGSAPAGVTGSFDPAGPTGTSSTLTVSVGAAVSPGVYDLTVDGTGTAGDHSTPLTLTVEAAPDYSLGLDPAAFAVPQGANRTTRVTIHRTNFAGAVTLSLGNAPAGVTGSFDPAAPTGTSSTLTVRVAAEVPTLIYSLTVDGVGAPGNRSTPLTLAVSSAPNFTLSLSTSDLTVVQGANATTTVAIDRTNFTGAVTLSLGNAPTGVTASFDPAAPTGTSSALTVSVGSGVAPGVYNLTVDGTGTPGNRSTPLTLTVRSPVGGGNVTFDFSTCAVGERAVWLAYQDGTGPWTRVIGANDVYSFSITSGRGGVAYVLLGQGGTSSVLVQYMTLAEFTAGDLDICPSEPTGKTVNGSVAGLGAADLAAISLGGGSATTVIDGPFQIAHVADGTHDLVGYRRSPVGGPSSAIIRRDLNVPNNGSVGTLDFAGPEAFTPATAIITAGGLVGGESVTHTTAYHVGATCAPATLYGAEPATESSFTASGIPADRQRASDYHVLTIYAATEGGFRSVTESFHTLAARTVTLGAQPPTPAITSLGGPYKRLQAVYMLPVDYQALTAFGYSDADRFVSLSATVGYLGGAATSLALADYSDLGGWDNNWAPAASATSVPWTLSAFSSFNVSPCTESARVKFAAKDGTF